MGVSAEKGPKVFYGTRAPIGSGGSENPDAGPGMAYMGLGLIDPRVGYNQGPLGAIGWYGLGQVCVLDQAPSTLSTTAIAAAQVPTANTKLTLVSSAGAGITPLTAALQVYGSGNIIPVGALAIDGSPGLVGIGTPLPATGNTRLRWYDPTKAIARNIQIASVGNDSGGSFLVSGYDLYGYPQTERITGANAGTAAGHKAFKFVTSVLPSSGLSGSNVSVGQGDTYGFGLRVDEWCFVDIYWAGALITASTGWTAADTTSPATSATGDVRGTYHVQSASNGTNKLQVFVSPTLSQVSAAPATTGLFGQTPA